MKLFNCFTKETKIIKDPKPIYFNCLDKQNSHLRDLLYSEICEFVGYEENDKPTITNNIQDLKTIFENYFSNGVIPIYFQQTFFIIDADKLKDVIFNKIHSKNIYLLLQALNDDNEDSE